MRITPWTLFASILVAVATYYLANPFGIPSFAPLAPLPGFVLYSRALALDQPTQESGDLLLLNTRSSVLAESTRGNSRAGASSAGCPRPI